MTGGRFCFLNGRFIETKRAAISVTDRGLLFGEGLFETWRTYRGVPFAVKEHVARLARSARRLRIPFDPGEPWERRTRRLVRSCGAGRDGTAVRLTITRGPGPLRLVPDDVVRPTRLMLMRPIEPGVAEARARGVGVHLLDAGAGSSLGGLKTINYITAVAGKTEAARRGCFESIYRLDDSSLLEGTTSNLFVVRAGALVTPPVAHGVLPGVTRALVMRLAARIAAVREARVTAADLADCDEAFLTATTIEIVPIVRVGRRRVGGGEIGPLTRELQRRYRTMVARRLGLSESELGD